MTELGEIFAELGISHYLNDFIEQGFDSWDTILDITESDFDVLGVKLGHRRKLQRKIANSRGLSSDRALASPTQTTPNEDKQREEAKASGSKGDVKDGGPHGAKRKYRRHPKPDENAPERPPSAYVIFSNKMRDDLKGRNLTFTEIAKLVGENWQNLSPAEKEPYEQQAYMDKERYNTELAKYKKTKNYRDYAQYLIEFKARQSNTQQASDSDASKRPKLEPHLSTASNGPASSSGSQHGSDLPITRPRVESSTSQWQVPNGQLSPSHSTTPQPLTVSHVRGTSQGSPKLMSPTALPGFRDSLIKPTQHTLAWREGQREDNTLPLQKVPRFAESGERRTSYSGPDYRNTTGSVQHLHRTGKSHTPPSLTSESTTLSSDSSISNSSSMYFTPRTPMEPSLERSLPLPNLFSQKSPGNFDPQLPPFRVPSLSPQISSLGTQQSPNGMIEPTSDYVRLIIF